MWGRCRSAASGSGGRGKPITPSAGAPPPGTAPRPANAAAPSTHNLRRCEPRSMRGVQAGWTAAHAPASSATARAMAGSEPAGAAAPDPESKPPLLSMCQPTAAVFGAAPPPWNGASVAFTAPATDRSGLTATARSPPPVRVTPRARVRVP